MYSLSNRTYRERAHHHKHLVARRFLEIARAKQSNLVISADLATAELLEYADRKFDGSRISSTIFKHSQASVFTPRSSRHTDFVQYFSSPTARGLKALAKKHNFSIFKDRRFVNIRCTVQKQYHSGTLEISEFTDIVNMSILSGEGAWKRCHKS